MCEIFLRHEKIKKLRVEVTNCKKANADKVNF